MSTPANPAPTSAASAVVSIAVAVLPLLPSLITDIVGLFRKYPQLSPSEIAAAVVSASTQADASFADVLATIAADQAPKA